MNFLSLEGLLTAAAIGATAGIVIGSLRAAWRRGAKHNYSDPAVQKQARFNRALIRFFSKAIYAVLGVGIVWTVYYMVLGLADSRKTEYAANASTLIVSVVTLFSIVMAYYEFAHRGGAQKEKRDSNDNEGKE